MKVNANADLSFWRRAKSAISLSIVLVIGLSHAGIAWAKLAAVQVSRLGQAESAALQVLELREVAPGQALLRLAQRNPSDSQHQVGQNAAALVGVGFGPESGAAPFYQQFVDRELLLSLPTRVGTHFLYLEQAQDEFSVASSAAMQVRLEITADAHSPTSTNDATILEGAELCSDLPITPSLNDIDLCLRRHSAALKMPLAMLRAMVTHESGWSTTVLSGDCGIGLMQITPFPTPVSTGCTRDLVMATPADSLDKAQGQISAGTQGDNDFVTGFVPNVRPDRQLLFDDWRYNLAFGLRFLLSLKARSASGAPDFYSGLDASIVENWFYPASWYNSGAGVASGPAFGLHSKPRGNANFPANFPYFERLLNVAAKRQNLSSAVSLLIGDAVNVSLPGPNLVQNVTQAPAPAFAFANFCAGDRIRYFVPAGSLLANKQANYASAVRILGNAELLNLTTRGSAECPGTALQSLASTSIEVLRVRFGLAAGEFANGFE